MQNQDWSTFVLHVNMYGVLTELIHDINKYKIKTLKPHNIVLMIELY